MQERTPTGLHRNRKWIVPVQALVLILYGCAPTPIKMDREERVRLEQVTNIHAVQYPPPSLDVRTAGTALAGGGGGLGAIFSLGLFKSAGEKMTHRYSLQDPVVAVEDRFLSSVDSGFGLKSIAVGETLGDDGLDGLKKTFGEGMVFDFKTTEWRLFYFPMDWSHYRIAYSARSRLIRLKDSEILWQGVCKFVGQDPKTSPTWERLTANNGTILKIKLNEAADACSKELVSQFRGTN